MNAEIVSRGIRFLEGPVWCDDGTLLVTGVGDGLLYRVWPDGGRREIFADVGGGPNGAAPCSDGGVLVTQNGGFDFSRLVDDAPRVRPAQPGIQRVTPAGQISYLVREGLNAPNDLVITPEGTVVFTDPGPYPPPDPPIARVMSLSPSGELHEVAGNFQYCNGIGIEPGETIVVVEQRGLMRLLPDGGREWVIETLGKSAGDGFCLDVEGNFYVAVGREHGVRVVSPKGEQLDFLGVSGEGIVTNCCFGGPQLRTLYATEMIPGGVVAWDGMPLAGARLTPFPV
jgi:gluconolactonase